MSVVLSEHLPLLASAPDGIQKLRGLILELAVRGKLMSQDPNDEPASQLLKRIVQERAKLEAQGICKKSKVTLLAANDERPFKLPSTWEWVRLGAISEKLTDGSHNPPSDARSGTPMLSSQNVQDGWIDTTNPSRYLSEQDFALEDSRTKIKPDDVLLTIVASIGRSAVVKEEHPRFALQRSVAVIHTKLVPEFMSLQLRAPAARRYYDQHGKGTAQKGIYLGKLGEMPVAVPPLAEQHRIVAKVDELMALCDRLEAEQADAASAHTRLIETLVGTLTQSTDATDLAANWQRLAEHFETLFTTEASIDALKQTVLQLAVMGKLVPQDPNDEPSSKLLERISREKARLAQTEGLRTTAEPSLETDERYIEIPGSWQFQRLGNIAKFIDYRGKTPEKTSTGVPLITAKNVRFGYISREPREFVSELEYTNWMTRGLPRLGDILFTTEAPLGNVAIVDINERFALAQRVICLQFHEPQIAAYLLLALMSMQVRRRIEVEATGMTATGIKASRLKEIPVPLPPLAEQHRIVAKVDELMTLCDRLKADLATARQHQATLADTLIDAALEAA